MRLAYILRISFLAAIGLASSVRADDPAAAGQLEGRWQVVALESDGRKAPVESLAGGGWTFKGSEVTFDDPNAPGRSSFKLDPSKDPKEIDLIGADAPQKGKTIQGIYRVVDGRLTICLRDLEATAKGRPKEFATQPGSGLGLIVLERSGD